MTDTLMENMVAGLDRPRDRRASDSEKWNAYDADVLPMWVADMDFTAPEPVIQALHARIEHGIFGYGTHPIALAEVICERLQRLYRWSVPVEAITFLPGVVPGFNVAVRALAKPGGRVLIQPPVYPPILRAAANAGLTSNMNPLVQSSNGRWEVDFARFQASAGPENCAFLLCNPHNPVGRVFLADELARMAEICLRHNTVILADEIHCDLLFSGHVHTPVAALDPEIGRRVITLMSPSKTFNIAGLEAAFAIIPDAELRRRFEAARAGTVQGLNILAAVAALAAYREGHAWLQALIPYLEANRDFLQEYAREHLPGIRLSGPEGTYLAWLDCRPAELPCKPGVFFRERARVALNEGTTFGPGGEGFARLNFGCPRRTLEQGLCRLRDALEQHRTETDPRHAS